MGTDAKVPRRPGVRFTLMRYQHLEPSWVPDKAVPGQLQRGWEIVNISTSPVESGVEIQPEVSSIDDEVLPTSEVETQVDLGEEN